MNSITSDALKTNITTEQPRGLYVLFFTELWERYGFYTVQGLTGSFLNSAFLTFRSQKLIIFLAPFGGDDIWYSRNRRLYRR